MLAASVFTLFLQRWLQPWAAVLVAVALPLPLLLYHVRRVFAPAPSLFHALAGSVSSYRDGDFSGGVHLQGRGECREMVASHTHLDRALSTPGPSDVQLAAPLGPPHPKP